MKAFVTIEIEIDEYLDDTDMTIPDCEDDIEEHLQEYVEDFGEVVRIRVNIK